MVDTGMTDQALMDWADRVKAQVRHEQQQVAEALQALANAAREDADAVVTVPPESFAPTYLEHVDRVLRARVRLDNERADLTAIARARDARLATRDVAGSASRQHYIDTGNYLNRGGVEDHELPSIEDEWRRCNALIGKRVLFHGTEVLLTRIERRDLTGVKVFVRDPMTEQHSEGWAGDVSAITAEVATHG